MTAKPDHVELTAASRALTVSPLFAGRSMSRIVPAVVAGLILGQVTALIFWWWGFYLSPPSLLYDMSPALARSHPGGLPFMALLWQALGQGLGAYLGGAWAGRIAREGPAAAWGVLVSGDERALHRRRRLGGRAAGARAAAAGRLITALRTAWACARRPGARPSSLGIPAAGR
jgi:hypothetical protein